MDYFTFKDSKLSKFTIGTNQLGEAYGIGTLGKPSYEEAQSMLEYALDFGINIFDTGPNYGDSEEIIGNFLNHHPGSGVYVVTKLDYYLYNKNIWQDKKAILKKIRADVDLSCKRLGLEKLPVYLIHNESKRTIFENDEAMFDILLKIKSEGKIGSFGMSVYTDDELKKCIEDERVEVVQIPYNILDRRLSLSGLLKMAKKRGIAVFARSTYLQGMLTMGSQRIPEFLGEAVKYIEELNIIAKKSNRSIKELCLKYVLSVEGIDSIVVGINSIGQIRENIEIFNSEPLKKETIDCIDRIPIPPEYILNPGMWNDLKNRSNR